MNDINFEKIIKTQFSISKKWYLVSIACGVTAFFIDIFAILENQLSVLLVYIAIFLPLINTISVWRSDKFKEIAEKTLQKFELSKSLGWEISTRDIADLLVDSPKRVKVAANSVHDSQYFASNLEIGSKKLLSNLEESAWWTSHLSKRMCIYVGSIGIVMLILSFTTLFIALINKTNPTFSENIAMIIISLIVFLFSGGYIRLAFDYHHLSSQSKKISEIAELYKNNIDITEIDAVILLHDYQIDRVISPLIPDWIWLIMRDQLNSLWVENSHVK